MTVDPTAELVGVTRRYGSTVALEDVDLVVRPGEIVALLGPNGAGKSTAMNVLVGLRRPDSGRARLFGLDPRLPRARLRLGCTPQETSLPQTLTVQETIDLVRAHYPQPVSTAQLLDRFDLGAVKARHVGGLSGGMRRRVAVALAFAGSPELLVLDEPTTGLDVSARRIIWDAVREHAAGGRTVLLTTHYLDEAEELATRVAVIARARIRAEGTVAEIRERAGLSRIRIRSQDAPVVAGAVRRESRNGTTTYLVHDAGAVVRELVARGCELGGLEVTKATLEEAFLEITGDVQ